MNQPDDHETRISRLETQVAHARDDAQAARVLASAADRDAMEIKSDLRDFRNATNASFNALRLDMNDGFARGDELLDNEMTRVRGQLDGMAAGISQIAESIQVLIDRDNSKE